MLDNDIVISAIDKYAKCWISHILLSLVITSSVMASVFILVYMQEMSPWFYLLIFFCFFVAVLFTAYTISFPMKKKPSYKGKIIVASLVQALILTFMGAVFRQTMQYGINKWICYISFGVLAWILGGVLVLSMCHMIKKNELSLVKLVLNNKKTCAKTVLSLGMITVLVIYAALGFAIPHLRFNSFATYNGVKRTERRYICLFMLIFIPLYILTFVSLYEHMLSEKE
ncbi:MAG: hypothetical protein IKU45_04520 [Clostridia bacterium]|nr:hypothetical protein [Clostridia bacterium]